VALDPARNSPLVREAVPVRPGVGPSPFAQSHDHRLGKADVPVEVTDVQALVGKRAIGRAVSCPVVATLRRVIDPEQPRVSRVRRNNVPAGPHERSRIVTDVDNHWDIVRRRSHEPSPPPGHSAVRPNWSVMVVALVGETFRGLMNGYRSTFYGAPGVDWTSPHSLVADVLWGRSLW
jgi:hypothetical protein